jgi:diaminopimelate decarboxylase
MSEIAKVILESVDNNLAKYNLSKPRLIIEPGRSIIGTSGVTLYTVGSSKQVPDGKKYIAVDGGMADNPRPSLYQAVYTAVVANKVNDDDKETVTIAGRFCESGDILINSVELPKTVPGDIICVFATGAYNYSMSSNYNRIPKPEAILVQNGQTDVIIKRETYEDIVSLDEIPQRLSC